MIIVWGSIQAQPNHLEEVIQLCLEHVHRSRLEAGCISHSVQIDVENSNRLVFFEQWQDMPSLQAHFQVPESGQFVTAAAKLASCEPEMKIYQSFDEISGPVPR